MDSVEGTETVDERDVRALTQYLTVLEDDPTVRGADDMYLVVSESGRGYVVDARSGACECPDFEYRAPAGGCKHVRRVQFATGAREIPADVDPDAIDDQLGYHVSATPLTPKAVATDGGVIVAPDDAEVLDEPEYSRHIEPLEQGGEVYDECRACGAELLVKLGGRRKMLHREGCSAAGEVA